MNILIVDDEAIMINIIKRVVNWERVGVEKVYTAYNVRDARLVIESEKIDIVLCDIEMPQENGLDLIRWIEEKGYKILSLILTGYPDFHYAQEAVSRGVHKFLLKPVKYKELEEAIHDAVTKVREEQTSERQRKLGKYMEDNKKKIWKDFFCELIRKEILPSERWIFNEAQKRGLSIEKSCPHRLVIFRVMDGDGFANEKNLLWFSLTNITEELFPKVIVFSFEGKLVWMLGDKIGKDELKKMCEDFQVKVKRFLRYEIYAYILMDNISFQNLSTRYRDLEDMTKNVYRVGQSIYFMNEDTNIQDGARMFVRERSVVKEVQSYLEEHYAEKIGRNELEELVHLNQDYLNRIFKSATGYTLMEYIQYCRICKAKELLAESEYSIGAIAGDVGFDSPPYFSKIFKKWVGCSPVEYREQREKEEV